MEISVYLTFGAYEQYMDPLYHTEMIHYDYLIQY